MAVKIHGVNDFLAEIATMPGGEKINLCIQCGTCSASCPNADKMDYTPRELIAMARAGMRQEVLSSNSMWLCLSCFYCTVRCPRDIVPTYIMHALEHLAMHHHVPSRRTYTPELYRIFSDTVRKLGLIPRLGCMVNYLLKSNPLRGLSMWRAAFDLFTHGRIQLKVTKLKPEAMRQFKAILDKAEVLGEPL